jgi:hypothetical protein
MMNFESDLPGVTTIVIPTGSPDLLDVWYHEHFEDPAAEEIDQAWGEWRELTFDPDV